MRFCRRCRKQPAMSPFVRCNRCRAYGRRMEAIYARRRHNAGVLPSHMITQSDKLIALFKGAGGKE